MQDSFFSAARGSVRLPQVLPKSPHTTDGYWLAEAGLGWETCQQNPSLKQMTITARPWNLTKSQSKRIIFQAPFLQVLHVRFKDVELWEGVSNFPKIPLHPGPVPTSFLLPQVQIKELMMLGGLSIGCTHLRWVESPVPQRIQVV